MAQCGMIKNENWYSDEFQSSMYGNLGFYSSHVNSESDSRLYWPNTVEEHNEQHLKPKECDLPYEDGAELLSLKYSSSPSTVASPSCEFQPYYTVDNLTRSHDYPYDSSDCRLPAPQKGPPVVKRRNTANRKERRRTLSINHAFADLRDHIPNVPADTKLSKIKTLRLAISYISYLMDAVNSDDPNMAAGFKADLSSSSRKNGAMGAFYGSVKSQEKQLKIHHRPVMRYQLHKWALASWSHPNTIPIIVRYFQYLFQSQQK